MTSSKKVILNSTQLKLTIDRLSCEIIENHSSQKNLKQLITFVEDRQAHDKRYAIDSRMITNELNWKPKHTFSEAISITLDWYIRNLDWCHQTLERSGYKGQRLGK